MFLLKINNSFLNNIARRAQKRLPEVIPAAVKLQKHIKVLKNGQSACGEE